MTICSPTITGDGPAIGNIIIEPEAAINFTIGGTSGLPEFSFDEEIPGGAYEEDSSYVVYQSPSILRALVPGQVFLDNALTNFANRQYLAGGINTLGMAAEIGMMFVGSGAGSAAMRAGSVAAKSSTALITKSASYPPARGFLLGYSKTEVLQAGTTIDRFGLRSGTFASPRGLPFAARGLHPNAINAPYEVYEILKPLNVKGGLAAPAFGFSGLGIQYELPASVQLLIEQGYLGVVR